METVSVPLLNEHLECTAVGDVNIYKHMLPQSQFSLVDSLLFCVFSLRFKWSAQHILSKTTLTLTVWQCKMCKMHMGCFTNFDWTSSHNYVWIIPDLFGTFWLYLISWVLLDFTWSLGYFWILPHLFTSFRFCLSQVPGKSDQCLLLLVD